MEAMIAEINKANEELAAEREQKHQAVVAKLTNDLELCMETKSVYRNRYLIEKFLNEDLEKRLKKSEELLASKDAELIQSRLTHSEMVREADRKVKKELAEMFAEFTLESTKLIEEIKENAERMASEVLGVQREREHVDTCGICDGARREIIVENQEERKAADSDESDAEESKTDAESDSTLDSDFEMVQIEAKVENEGPKEKQDQGENKKKDDDKLAAVIEERLRLIKEDYLAWEGPKPYFEEVARRRFGKEEWWTEHDKLFKQIEK